MKPKKIAQSIVKLIIAIIIVKLALVYRNHLIETSPKNQKKDISERSVNVRVQQLQAQQHQIQVTSSGVVIPQKELTLLPRVSGEIIKLHPNLEPGAYIKKGEIIAEIDPEDYEIAIISAQSLVNEAQFNYKLELGEQDVAQYEWDFIEEKDKTSDLEKSLILRQPHFEKAKSDLMAAEASLRKAKLDLARTKIRATYNFVVQERYVTKGSLVNSSNAIAKLINADTYWVQIAIPYNELRWIKEKDSQHAGAHVKVSPNGIRNPDVQWEGQVLQTLPDITEGGRRAKILVEIPKPLTQAKHPLLLNAYIRADIEGPTLDNIIKIPANFLRNGKKIYTLGQNNRLEIKNVEIIWQNDQFVYLKNIYDADINLVATDIIDPLPGLKLNVLED